VVGQQAGEERLRQSKVSFPCGKLTLEGICYYPEGSGAFPAVVLCHPHPLYGGSMDNNVILAACSALLNESITALVFNFRGVGGSEGSYGGGVAEQEDVKAAISWLISQPEVNGDRVGLLGYSFGAAVALPVACADERVKAVALISPPLEPSQVSLLKNCAKAKLVICGTDDSVVPPSQLELLKREVAEPDQFEVISGADHFWWGHEVEMADKAAGFFKDKL
jgi:alpha/beta superfamily hydrolase